MGQKVHPLGFRVGITKKHQSQWFARFHKQKYAQSVLEDRMLRQTLTNLFPQLLNPTAVQGAKKVQKRDEDLSVGPRITQIKIERGLIPYEIGIQIHAENCDLIKSSIDNLKMNRDLVCQLQKTRRYLQHLRYQLNNPLNSSEKDSLHTVENQNDQNSKTSTPLQSQTQKKEFGFRTKPRLTKQQLNRQRLILKRLKKRQSIRRRYKQMVYKGLFLSQNGNQVIQKLTRLVPSSSSGKTTKFMGKQSRIGGNGNSKRLNSSPFGSRNSSSSFKPRFASGGEQGESGQTVKTVKTPKYSSSSVLKSRLKKKFVSIFMNRMNQNFLQALKTALKKASETAGVNKQRPLGWNSKWNFTSSGTDPRLQGGGTGQHATNLVTKLTKLITVLEQKSFKKMENLRKDFIAFGSISNVASLNYYQMLMFLKQLKEHVSFIKRKQKLQQTIQKSQGSSLISTSTAEIGYSSPKNRFSLVDNNSVDGTIQGPSFVTNQMKLTLLSKKLNNIENECRKLKFIEYLKGLVKKHRSENIYLYLTTIGEARQNLRKLQQFTKRHASFLFGLNLSNTNNDSLNLTEKVKERVNNVCEKSFFKSDFEKTLQDIFLEQIEKQRKVYKDNAQLTPKIQIQFYAVNSKTIKAKASVVADSVVDALEKRKAFRKVIKDAKEELMRTSGVKGVKIQVSGRLNGAEIARCEWVRAGRVPLQTLRSNLDYSYKTASTIYGIIGIKVWIFKGYTKLI